MKINKIIFYLFIKKINSFFIIIKPNFNVFKSSFKTLKSVIKFFLKIKLT